MPAWLPAAISAGGSLLGGLLGGSKEKTVSAFRNSKDAISGQAYGARVAGEKYGFNPLTLLGVSSAVGPTTTTGANYMGQAIADAGLLVADALAKKQEETGRLSQLQQENEKLRQQLQQQTLRPKVGGVYAQRQATPTMRQALGVSNGSVASPVLDRSRDVVGSAGGNPVLGQRPPVHPFDRPVLMRPVRDVGGAPALIPDGVAERLGVPAFGAMLVEDVEAMYGEEIGQVVAAPRVGDVLLYHHTGKPPNPLVGDRESRKRDREAERKRKANKFRASYPWMLR